MIKVTHISTEKTGGAGLAALRLHLGLQKYSKEVNSSFLIMNKNGRDPVNNVYVAEARHTIADRIRRKIRRDADSLNQRRMTGRQFPGNVEIITFPYTSYRLENHNLIKEADIVNLHWVAYFLNYPTFFKNIKQPIVWTLHDMSPFQGVFHYTGDQERSKPTMGDLDLKILGDKIKAIHKKQNISIVCPSKWIMERSMSCETFGRYPHYHIPYGLDTTAYPDIHKSEAKAKSGVDNGLKTILFVAQDVINYRKGFDLLLDAVNQLNNEEFNLISVGGTKINADKATKHIHYTDIKDVFELNRIYSAADITIVASREDNLPLVMIESLMNGTPVISFNNGGMSEHIISGRNGILLNQSDALTLRNGLRDFLKDKYSFDKTLIRNYAFDTFAAELQVKRYEQLYKDILNG